MLNHGVQGREMYPFRPETPGSVTQRLVGPLTTTSNGGGDGTSEWNNEYLAILQANQLLAALDKATGITDQQKSAIKGFAKTIIAYELLIVIDGTEVGAVIDPASDLSGPPGPMVDSAKVYARIFSLLDGARTDLLAAGSTFPFTLSPGFAGFNTPVTFLTFNRALRARVYVYNQLWSDALTDLNASFLNPAASLTLGVYHSFGTGSGDTQNADDDPGPRALYGHPSFYTDAANRPDGTPDSRLQNKFFHRALGPFTFSGVTSDVGTTVYTTASAPIPYIRNEELILLRAEANLMLGNRAAALADINLIRQTSGGLAAMPDPGDPGLMTELIYNRRYSLFYEGHRWVDMRRWGLLSQLPKALPNHRIFSRFPVPNAECLPRTPAPLACTPDNGK